MKVKISTNNSFMISQETCVLEVDDSEDADIVDGLLDIKPPQGMQVHT